MVAAFVERRIREARKKQKQTTIGPGKRILDRPTATVLLYMLSTITVAYFHHDECIERLLPDNSGEPNIHWACLPFL